MFNQILSQILKDDDLHHVIYSDGELIEQELNLTTAEMLADALTLGTRVP